MKTAALFASLILATVVSTAHAVDRTTKTEILQMTAEINQAVRNDEFDDEQMQAIHAGLAATLDAAYNHGKGSDLICSKQSNSLFYPTSATSGEIVGESGYNAGYAAFDDCRANLPKRGEKVACFKQNNALFYPANAETGEVIGASSYNAGHAAANECRLTLPARGANLACYKQGNGLYYPSKAMTGEIIGSGNYSAGFSDLNACLKIINQ